MTELGLSIRVINSHPLAQFLLSMSSPLTSFSPGYRSFQNLYTQGWITEFTQWKWLFSLAFGLLQRRCRDGSISHGKYVTRRYKPSWVWGLHSHPCCSFDGASSSGVYFSFKRCQFNCKYHYPATQDDEIIEIIRYLIFTYSQLYINVI